MPDPGTQLDTGPGGFGIDGRTYTMDTGVPEQSGGDQGPRSPTINTSAAFVDGTGAPKDLTQKTKTTLAQYFSNVTLGREGTARVSNRYPVDVVPATTVTTSDDKGYPIAPTTPVNSTTFAPDETQTSATSAQFTSLATLKKGKSASPGTDGNDLLAGLPGDATYVARPNAPTGAPSQAANAVAGHASTARLVQPYVSAVLANNRFAAAGTNQQRPFAQAQDADDPPSAFEPAFDQQPQLGAFDPNAPTVTAGRLASVGTLLTMRAAGEVGSTLAGANPNSTTLQAAALLPGSAQLVAQLDPRLLEARDVLQTLTTDELDQAGYVSPGGSSWGSLNNANDPFSGTAAVGMSSLSTALVAALLLLIDGISGLLGVGNTSGRVATRDKQGRYAVGEYYQGSKQATAQSSGIFGAAVAATTNPLSTLNFGALLGIQPTNFPFNQALSVGANAFFGIQQNADVPTQLLGALQSSADSPGFNVVVIRSIIRSGAVVTDALASLGGNPVNVAAQSLALVDTIRSSKLIGACNVFAQLGDAILSTPVGFIDQQATGGLKVSQVDNNEDVLMGAAGKSRLKGTLKLAWASNRAPANLLLPAALLGANAVVKGLGQFDPYLGIKQDAQSNVSAVVLDRGAGGRIDTATAQAFETALDSEYVPFYFHDVRTNEMVAFHAFLASLSDDFTASWEKSEGFGRVEPVKVYKSTERRISLSFYVAATSLNDFDEMWLKLNKLVTMVYPQYTRGVQLLSQDKSYAFTQPFSQLVGAAPMIRLRLGDLLKSNYSRFALGRLFGLGNPDFTVNGQQLTDDSDFDQGQLDRLSQLISQARSNPNSETYLVGEGSYPQYVDTGPNVGSLLSALPSPSVPGVGALNGPRQAPTFSPSAAGVTPFFMVKALKLHPDNPQLVVCEVAYNDDKQVQKAFSLQLAAGDKQFNNPDLPLQRVIGGKYVVPAHALTPTKKTKDGLVSQLVTANSEFATELTTFLQDAGTSANAVAKSFKDTGGKGLAGVIETLSFQWLERTTWETTLGRTAPKLCLVNIGFSPIHDISPGIDHNGFDRAPVYGVGLLSPQSETQSQ